MEPTSKHQVVCFGEVLWDILPSGALPGGAPMNVAYHLKKLGSNPALISKTGRDDYGEQLVNILAENGVITEYLQTDSKYPTGLVYANVSNHHEVTYDIIYPSAWDYILWNDEFTSLMEQAEFFIYGSLTSRNEISRNTLYRLLDLAKTKVLDINLRKPHFSQKHLEYLLQKADILKMNEAELDLVSSWFIRSENIEEKMNVVQDKFSIETLIVTKGGDGAIVNDKGNTYHHKGYKVSVADTIGSGDAFLAGFIDQSLKHASIQEALNFASGIGAFVATRSGGCPAYDIAQITALMNLDTQAG